MNIKEIEPGTFEMTNRGTAYTLIKATDGSWSLWSSRLALRSVSVRVFAKLEDLEKTIKAFRGVAALLA